MNKRPINREWPYCTEFEFIKFKKVLNAKNNLSLRMVTHQLNPWVQPGQLIQFNYHKRNRPQFWKYGDIVAYWDTKKVSAGIYLGFNSKGVLILQRKSGITTVKTPHLLARIPELRLPWYRRFLVWIKAPSGLGRDLLIPRGPEDSIHKSSES